jgi:hypothetical protein
VHTGHLNRLWCLAIPFVLGPGAQSPPLRYRLVPGDTLRYTEQTEGRITMRMPQGPIDVATTHEAAIAVVAERADTVLAWYERLTLTQTGGGSAQRPGTDSALRRPFRLLFPPDGRVATVSTPIFPAAVARQTDLTHQFEDFFISLPAAALRPGATWSDTVEVTTAGRPQDSYRSHRVRSYRVLRDTTVAGARAVVIGIEQTITLAGTSPFEGQPVTASTRLDGRESGIAVFAPAAGRLLARDRRGRLEGEFTMEGPERRAAFPQTYDYSSSLRLVAP